MAHGKGWAKADAERAAASGVGKRTRMDDPAGFWARVQVRERGAPGYLQAEELVRALLLYCLSVLYLLLHL